MFVVPSGQYFKNYAFLITPGSQKSIHVYLNKIDRQSVEGEEK